MQPLFYERVAFRFLEIEVEKLLADALRNARKHRRLLTDIKQLAYNGRDGVPGISATSRAWKHCVG
jgi:hypothetical protein